MNFELGDSPWNWAEGLELGTKKARGAGFFLLVLVAEEVVDRLYGVEGGEGNLNEDGVPVTHGTIPEAGELEGFQLLATLGLRRDETGGLIDEIGQVESVTLVVLHGADQVDGVEMGSLREHLHIGGVVLVDLGALENLERDGTILVIGQERTTTRLTHVLYHATDTHRAIQFATEVVGIDLVTLGTAAETVLYKVSHLLQVSLGSTGIELMEVSEGLLLQGYQYTGDNLLPLDGLGLQAVGNDIIDILDEDDISLDLIEILNQGTMTTGTEEQLAIALTEGGVIGIGSDGIGRGFLLREGDIVLNTIFLSKAIGFLGYLRLEEGDMLMGDGEMDMSLAVRSGIEGTLYQVFLHRGAGTFGIGMEEEHALRQLSVVQALGLEHVGSDSLVVTGSEEGGDILSLVLLTGGVQGVVESELLDVSEELLLEIGGGHIVIGIDKGEHVLEHATGGT